MAVAAVFTFPRSGIEQYEAFLEAHAAELRHQPARQFHVCFETDDGYMVVDVWDSLEAFERFGEVIDDVARDVRRAEHAPPLTPVQLRLHRVHTVI